MATQGRSSMSTDSPGVGEPSATASTSAAAKPELPWAFIDCPTDTLVLLIAHMLDLLCQHNDQVVLTPDALTRFHSRAPPGITVVDYLRRIVKYTNLEKIPLLSLLAYIDLTCQNLPTFTLSSLTVHRFLIAGVTAGSKAQCDVFCTNAHYAKVGGIKVGELNMLEREFLRVTGWALCCSADLLQRYYTSLIRSHGVYAQAAEPEVSPFTPFPDAGKPPPVESVPPTPVDSVEGTQEQEPAVEEAAEEAAEVREDGEASNAGRGRSRQRESGSAMEVDSPPPDKVERPGLKSLVGGMFRRNDGSTTSNEAASASGSSGSGMASSSSSRPTRPHSSPNGSPVETKPVTPRVRTREERSVDSLRPGVERSLASGLEDSGKRRARVE